MPRSSGVGLVWQKQTLDEDAYKYEDIRDRARDLAIEGLRRRLPKGAELVGEPSVFRDWTRREIHDPEEPEGEPLVVYEIVVEQAFRQEVTDGAE